MAQLCCGRSIMVCTGVAAVLGAGALMLSGGRTVADDRGMQGHDHGHGEHGQPAALTSKNYVPVQQIHLYLCAFHIAKSNPKFAVEAHHYCSATMSPLVVGSTPVCAVGPISVACTVR